MQLYTVPQACQRLQVSRTKVYELIRMKKLGHVKIGRTTRFSDADLEEFVQRSHISPRKR